MLQMQYIDDLDQAAALLKPMRVELLKRLGQPRSCPELAELIGSTKQKVYYHIKILEKEGLVEKIDERRTGGIMEGMYQATARSYWLSPRLVGQIGGQSRARDQMSLGFILSLAEEMQNDIGRLTEREAGEEIPSFGLSAYVQLRDQAERARFMAEVKGAIRGIAERYGATGTETGGDRTEQFRLMLSCYPATDTSGDN